MKHRKSILIESFETELNKVCDELWRAGIPKKLEFVSVHGIKCVIEYPGVILNEDEQPTAVAEELKS